MLVLVSTPATGRIGNGAEWVLDGGGGGMGGGRGRISLLALIGAQPGSSCPGCLDVSLALMVIMSLQDPVVVAARAVIIVPVRKFVVGTCALRCVGIQWDAMRIQPSSV